MPAIYALYIINKSGGLIYNRVGEICDCCSAEADIELNLGSRAGVYLNVQPQPERYPPAGQHLVMFCSRSTAVSVIGFTMTEQ